MVLFKGVKPQEEWETVQQLVTVVFLYILLILQITLEEIHFLKSRLQRNVSIT